MGIYDRDYNRDDSYDDAVGFRLSMPRTVTVKLILFTVLVYLAQLLSGFRGRPAADRAALETAALALGRFFLDHRTRISDIEINPLMVRPKGAGAVAVDVRAVWRQDG